MAKKNLADFLVAQGAISEADARAALDHVRHTGKPLPQAILDVTLIDETTLAEAQGQALGIPYVKLGGLKLNAAALGVVDEAFCQRVRCLPFDYHEAGRFLDVAMADPADAAVYDQIRVRAKCNIRPHVAEPSLIADGIRWAFGHSAIGGLPPLPERSGAQPETDHHIELGQAQYCGGHEYDFGEDAATASRRATTATGSGEVAALQTQVGQLAGQVQAIGKLLEQLSGQVAALSSPQAREGRAATEIASTAFSRPAKPLSTSAAPGSADEDILIDTHESSPATVLNPLQPEVVAETYAPTLEVPLGKLSSRCIVVMDFGTSRSSVAAVIEGKAQPLPMGHEQWDMPSVVSFRADGTVVVGAAAKEALVSRPKESIASPKRLLGRQITDPTIAPYLAQLHIATSPAPNGEILLELPQGQVSVPEVCSRVIATLRNVAEEFLHQPVTEAVLMIPSGYDERQRTALRTATKIAGLTRIHLLEEPVAAALSNYRDPEFRGLIAVYDFGGGTFDFAVLEHTSKQTRIVGTAGDTWLGGDDIDLALASAAADDFWRQVGVQLRHQEVQWQRVLAAAEQAKIALSTQTSATIAVPQVAHTSAGNLNLHYPLQRPLLAQQIKPLVQRSFETCMHVLTTHQIKKQDIHSVYISGGSCWIPAIQATVAQFFGKTPKSMVRPERAVLLGGAVHAVARSR